MPPTLLERAAPVGADADSAYTDFVEWATDHSISLYPAQDKAVTELVSGANVILSTPPGRESRSSPSRRTRRASPGADALTTPPRSSEFDRLLAAQTETRRVGGVARDSASARADAGLDAGGRADRGVVHCANVRPACPTRRLLLAAANDVPLGRLFAAAAAAGAESAVVGDLQPAVEAGFLTVDGDRI